MREGLKRRNGRRKREQKDFFEYRKTVGEKVPKTLEEFQELRYNDTEIFSFIKLDYMRRKNLIKYPEKALPSSRNFVLDDKKFMNYLFGGNLENRLAKGRAKNRDWDMFFRIGKTSKKKSHRHLLNILYA